MSETNLWRKKNGGKRTTSRPGLLLSLCLRSGCFGNTEPCFSAVPCFFPFARLFIFLLFYKTKPQRAFLWGPYIIGFSHSLCGQISRIRCAAINMSVGLICMKRVKLRTSTANQIGIQREHIRRIGYFIYIPFIASVNYHPSKGRWLLRVLRLCLRSLIFKFPPDRSGNPYSYRRVHFASTV